jgi:hypothetical protein
MERRKVHCAFSLSQTAVLILLVNSFKAPGQILCRHGCTVKGSLLAFKFMTTSGSAPPQLYLVHGLPGKHQGSPTWRTDWSVGIYA